MHVVLVLGLFLTPLYSNGASPRQQKRLCGKEFVHLEFRKNLDLSFFLETL